MHRAISLMLVALMATSCTRTVEIPREELEKTPPAEKTRLRIQTTDGSQYRVSRFVVTDSTLVIQELDPSDERYAKTAALPITVLLNEIESISRVEVNETLIIFGVAILAACVLFAVHLAKSFPDTF